MKKSELRELIREELLNEGNEFHELQMLVDKKKFKNIINKWFLNSGYDQDTIDEQDALNIIYTDLMQNISEFAMHIKTDFKLKK